MTVAPNALAQASPAAQAKDASAQLPAFEVASIKPKQRLTAGVPVLTLNASV